MFEDTTTAFVECPDNPGDAAEVAAVVQGDTLVWACPTCHEEHSASIDYGDDEGWLDDIEVGRIYCE